MSALRTERLTLSYDSYPVLNNVSLELPTGQITAVIGPNGSGKSTLLRGLAGLIRPLEGRVLLGSEDISLMPVRAIAHRVSMLPQGPVAPPGLLVRELIEFGRTPYRGLFRKWSANDERAVLEALVASGMTHLQQRRLDSLSGGQRQRAWIAMALAQETEFLLLDEPTTHLDLAHQLSVMRLLRALSVRGHTVVVVLQDLNQASRYADHLVALREGRVVAEGPPQDIISSTKLKEILDLSVRVMPDPADGVPVILPMTDGPTG